MDIEHYCPACGEETTFSLMASTQMHLGTKTKYWCNECDYELVLIGEDVDAAATAEA
ncbi:MAG: hypothetical protein ACOCP3_01495 [Halodesulfurarchaeum sp.]